MSTFPTSLDNLSTSHSDGTAEVIHASTINDLASAVNAIETTAQFGLGIQYRDVQLNDGQIKALPTTPVELVAAPGPGLVIIPQSAWLVAFMPITAYDSISVDAELSIVTINGDGRHGLAFVQWIEDASSPVSQLLHYAGSNSFAWGNTAQVTPATTRTATSSVADGADQSFYEDVPLYLSLFNADVDLNPVALTGGDPSNTLSIRVWYAVVPAVPFGA